MVAEDVNDGSMFDENGFEGWCMTWNLVFKNAKVPLSQKTANGVYQVGATPMEQEVRRHEVLAFPSTMQWWC